MRADNGRGAGHVPLTDLANSTALLERVGDEEAQRVLRAHPQLLAEALAGHGGQEVQWLGDGVLATFASVAEAVRCAVTMQRQAVRPTAGERTCPIRPDRSAGSSDLPSAPGACGVTT
jgi:class 3 adenylate cyclase